MDVKRIALGQRASEKTTPGETAPGKSSVRVFHIDKITGNNSFIRTALTGLGLMSAPDSASPMKHPAVIRPAIVSAPKKDEDAEQVLKAVRERNATVLKNLLKDNTINVNYRDPQTGDTAWGLALRAGDQEMITLLKPALATAPRRVTRGHSESQQPVRKMDDVEIPTLSVPSPVILDASRVIAESHHGDDSALVGKDPDFNGASSTFKSDPWMSLPAKYRSETGVFDAIEADDQSALKLWLASNKFTVSTAHPETGLSPLLQALTLGRQDMVDDLVAAGANPDGIDLKSNNAIQSLSLSYIPEAYRSHKGMAKAVQEGKMNICANLHLSGILENAVVPNYYPPITSGDIEGHRFFHTRYNDTKNQILLLYPGMYFFRKSSQGGYAISYKDEKNQMISTRFNCRDEKIITESRGKTQSHNDFDELLETIMAFTDERQGVEDPWIKLNALDPRYLQKGGLLAAVADKKTDAIETLIMCGVGEHEIDDIAVSGKTALTVALETKNNTLARRLIRAGADPRAVDSERNTPMHIAAKNNDLDMIEFLIANEASTEEKNSAGMKPWQLATTEAAITRLMPAEHDDREQDSDDE